MQARLLLVLTLLILAAGCAQGYYDHRPKYSETMDEYEMHLWKEEAGR